MATTSIFMTGELGNEITLYLDAFVNRDDAPGISDMPGTKYKQYLFTQAATLVSDPVTGIAQVDATFWAAWKAANLTSDLLVSGALSG